MQPVIVRRLCHRNVESVIRLIWKRGLAHAPRHVFLVVHWISARGNRLILRPCDTSAMKSMMHRVHRHEEQVEVRPKPLRDPALTQSSPFPPMPEYLSKLAAL
jgi:hypothetical protein